MNDRIKALKAAFPKTIPVMTGYIFLGIAFGILLNAKGYGPGWALLMSLLIYAGSMQYVAVSLLVSAFNPMAAFVMTLMVNARHLFYGLSMLDRFKSTGKLKPYLIFGLTDETFSVLCGPEAERDVSKPWYMFWVTFLNQCYWIAGSVAGALISFDTTGIDFAMTALFIVIAVDQWKTYRSHLPALLGCGITVLSLVILRPDAMLIPALCVIIVALLLLRARLEGSRTEAEEEVV